MINYSVSEDFFLTLESHIGIFKTSINIKDYVQKFINSTLTENDRNEFLNRLEPILMNPLRYLHRLDDMLVSYYQLYGINNGHLMVFSKQFHYDMYSVDYDTICKITSNNLQRLFLLCVLETYMNKNGSEVIPL